MLLAIGDDRKVRILALGLLDHIEELPVFASGEGGLEHFLPGDGVKVGEAVILLKQLDWHIMRFVIEVSREDDGQVLELASTSDRQ